MKNIHPISWPVSDATVVKILVNEKRRLKAESGSVQESIPGTLG